MIRHLESLKASVLRMYLIIKVLLWDLSPVWVLHGQLLCCSQPTTTSQFSSLPQDKTSASMPSLCCGACFHNEIPTESEAAADGIYTHISVGLS